MTIKKKFCLISFFNTRSGKFIWWDEFPIEIRNRLNQLGVDCYYFYKSKTDLSLYADDEIFINPEKIGDGSLNDEDWLMTNLWPIMEHYEKVIIHIHSYYPPFKLKKLIQKHGNTEWVSTVHRCPVQQRSVLRLLYKILLRRFHYLPDWYIGVSEATSRYLKSNFGLSKILTIHNGINLSKIKAHRTPSDQANSNQKRYLFINRLDKRKGVDVLIGALPQIFEYDPDFYLTIVGDGPYQNDVEEFLNRSTAPNVSYAGYTSDVGSFYASHDVILMPYTEPQGLSLISLEARAYGLPAIYTAMGGVAETRTKENGIQMHDASPEALLAAIKKMDSELVFTKLIEGCYKGLDYFSLTRMTEDYCKFYMKLFKGSQ